MTENLEKFLKNPIPDNLCKLLNENIEEMKNFDFKEIWSSWEKIAKHILGITNSGIGAIIIGISQKDDKFDIKGLQKKFDKSDIEKGLRKYIPGRLDYIIHDFVYPDTHQDKLFAGKKFQGIVIKDNSSNIPFISLSEGNDIKKGIVYCRKGTNTEMADNDDIQEIIKRRIESQYCLPTSLDLDYSLKMSYSQDVTIKKDVPIDFGDYKAKLLTVNRSIAIVRLYVGEHFVRCIKFASGRYRFENYCIQSEGRH